jgi:hypothetical protein
MTQPVPDYTTSRRWRVPAPIPIALGKSGSWSTFAWTHAGHQQHGVVLIPEAAPWRRLVAALDDAPGAGEEPLDPFREADALVAVCWRYGSYVHVLTFGELYPPLRTDSSLSRIGDMEMMRIQIEASSALADCLRLRRDDPQRYNHRLRAALDSLPIPWQRPRDRLDLESLREAAKRFAATAQGPNMLTLDKLVTMGYALAEIDPDRIEANALLHGTYRNGSRVEDLHAGSWNPASEVPGYFRLYAPEVERMAGRFALSLAVEMAARERLEAEARMVLNVMRAPRAWTTTHETAIVAFAGLAGGPTLDQRLAVLTARYPQAYDTTHLPGAYDSYHERFTPGAGVALGPEVLLDASAPVRATYASLAD